MPRADSVGLVVKSITVILPLGLDTFAVAGALAMTGLPARQRVRVSLLFTAFEGAMPLVGLALDAPLGRAIGVTADYIAIAVLIAFGHESDETEGLANVLGRGPLAVLALGVSISIDELAIGFTLGLLRVPVVATIVVIASVSRCWPRSSWPDLTLPRDAQRNGR
jgi:putative Mn2+ efflux pump MntP